MPPYPATPLPYAESAVQAIIDPQLVENAQEAAWNACKDVGSHVATSVATSAATTGAVLFASQFSASSISNDLARLELSLTRMLGELEVRFILAAIDDRSEGFLDLLAAYNSLILENNAPRLELINMSGVRRNVDCFSQAFRFNKFTVVRMEALKTRCKATMDAADAVLRRRGERALMHVPLAYGYHPSGNAPWRCPVPDMPVRHIWIYDDSANPIQARSLRGYQVSSTSSGYMEAYNRRTRSRKHLYSQDKRFIRFVESMHYEISTDNSTGLAYVRELFRSPDENGLPSGPAEPPRRPLAEWPPVRPLVRAAVLSPPAPAYHPPEASAARPTITRQYEAQPQLSNAIASSSSRPAASYPPRPQAPTQTMNHGNYTTGAPPPSSRSFRPVVSQQPAPTAGMHSGNFGNYQNHVNRGA